MKQFYKKHKWEIFIMILIFGCIARVGTQYMYSRKYDAGVDDLVFWESLYFRGQGIFECFTLWFASAVVKERFNRFVYVLVDFFFSLSLFGLVKEYFLNPLHVQPGEYAAFYISATYTLVKATSKFWLAAVKKFIKHIKIIFK